MVRMHLIAALIILGGGSLGQLMACGLKTEHVVEGNGRMRVAVLQSIGVFRFILYRKYV